MIDMDTKEVIPQDFTLNVYPTESTWRTVRAGSDLLCNCTVFAPTHYIACNWEKYGYEDVDNSANIPVRYDEASDMYFIPWTINIFLRKIVS